MNKLIETYKELLESKDSMKKLIETNESRHYFLIIRAKKEIRLNISNILKDFDGFIDSSKILVFKNSNTNEIEILNNSIEPLVKRSNLYSYIENSETYNRYIEYVLDREYTLIETITSIEKRYDAFTSSIEIDELYEKLEDLDIELKNSSKLVQSDIAKIVKDLRNAEGNRDFAVKYNNDQHEYMNAFQHELEHINFEDYDILRHKALKKIQTRKFKI